MKNKIVIFIFYIFSFLPSYGENLNIQASSITIDKKTKITIFKNQVSAKDEKNNELLTEFAEYDKKLELFKTVGETTIFTSGGFVVEGKDMVFDNNKNYIKSNNPAKIKDLEKNEIYLDNFEYSTSKNFFQSSGNIKVIDSNKNQYNFSIEKADALSMAHGLEVRTPFLDRSVIEFAQSIPTDYKINRKHGKRIIRDTFSDLLPKSILTRSKKGFEIPLA